MHLAVLFAALVSLSTALYTPKGSSCTIECGTKASNFTGTGDLVCQDTAYNDNSKGVLFKQCLLCLSNSTYVNDANSFYGNSDQYWYMWHLKYVQQYCLIDTPQTAAAKNCASNCKPLKNPLDVSWVYNKAGVQSQYGYCSWNSSTYMTYASGCASCLQGEEGGVVIGNIADTAYNACKLQPLAANGELVTSSRDLFDSAIIGPSATSEAMSTSSATPSSASDAATTGSSGSTTATTALATTDASAGAASSVQPGSGGLSSAAAAGLGVGATVLILSVAAGIFFVMRRRKRAPPPVRLTTPPIYAHELGDARQVNEMEQAEKTRHKTSVHETGGLPLQELDASGHR